MGACVVQDLPDGNYHELKKSGSKAKGKPHKEFLTALLCDPHHLDMIVPHNHRHVPPSFSTSSACKHHNIRLFCSQ